MCCYLRINASVLRKHLLFCKHAVPFLFLFLFLFFLSFFFNILSIKGEEGCVYRTTKARMVAEVLGVDSSCEARSPPKDCGYRTITPARPKGAAVWSPRLWGRSYKPTHGGSLDDWCQINMAGTYVMLPPHVAAR